VKVRGKLFGLVLATALSLTGAETAFADTPTPSPAPAASSESPSATPGDAAAAPAIPTDATPASGSPTPTEAAPAPASSPADQRVVQPADVTTGAEPAPSPTPPPPPPAPTYRPYCENLYTTELVTPDAQTTNGISVYYLGRPVAVGDAPELATAPKEGAIFNDPNSATGKVAIIKQLLDGLRAAKNGETVKVAMYSMTRWDAARAIIRAYCRGVNIQYLTDNHSTTFSATIAVQKVLAAGAALGIPSAFKACYLSCSSDFTWKQARVRVVTVKDVVYRPYMHSKYLTFSSVAGQPYVSMVASGNFTSTQIKNGWNNVYTTLNDKTTYDFLGKKFDQMWLDQNTNLYEAQTSTDNGISKTTYQFPWTVANPKNSTQTVNPATDPYTKFLENVKCTGTASGYGNSKHRTQVYVSMYQWTSSRLYLARRLKHLKDTGCDVRVLMSASEWDLEVMPILRKWDVKKVKTTYKFGNIPIRNGDVGSSNFIHSKFIIVNGAWGGDNSVKMVFTGSGNWTKSSLRFSNETNILIRSHQAYNQFKSNWNKLWGSKKYSVPITKLKKKTSRGDV
jgi:phosphatidylserine/phosphatidylglycerophosphate/cardiolipin synthase-like enzyme